MRIRLLLYLLCIAILSSCSGDQKSTSYLVFTIPLEETAEASGQGVIRTSDGYFSLEDATIFMRFTLSRSDLQENVIVEWPETYDDLTSGSVQEIEVEVPGGYTAKLQVEIFRQEGNLVLFYREDAAITVELPAGQTVDVEVDLEEQAVGSVTVTFAEPRPGTLRIIDVQTKVILITREITQDDTELTLSVLPRQRLLDLQFFPETGQSQSQQFTVSSGDTPSVIAF